MHPLVDTGLRHHRELAGPALAGEDAAVDLVGLLPVAGGDAHARGSRTDDLLGTPAVEELSLTVPMGDRVGEVDGDDGSPDLVEQGSTDVNRCLRVSQC